MDWQFAQSFGTEESEDHGFCEGDDLFLFSTSAQSNIRPFLWSALFWMCSSDDIFTALDFDSSGKYIALGDKAGRITVFESVELEEDPKVGLIHL